MSHAMGTVFGKDDEELAYFDWNGTCDVALPKLYATRDECFDNWRIGPDADCTCGQPPISVAPHADYGDGLEWWDLFA